MGVHIQYLNAQLMKNLLPLTLLCLCLIALKVNAQEPRFYHGVLSPTRGSYLSAENTNPPVSNGGEGNFTGQSGTGANIDVVYQRIDWTIDPRAASNTITGTVLVRFKTIVSNVSTITIDLNSTSFNNGSLVVTYHGSTIAGRTLSGNILTIPLPATIAANGALDSFTVAYSGVPPGVSGAAQGYQRLGTAPNQFTSSLSESYEDRDWWPCKADMQDKIDSMDINVAVPWTGDDTFWVATNGVLYDSAISAGTRTFKFRTRYPIASYLVTLSVGKFTRYYRTAYANGTPVPTVYYILRNTTAHATKTAAMDKVNIVVDSFSRRFGDYPFKLEKHGFYDGLAGASGMEHQTFSGIASGSMASLGVLNHELAHQWFGDNVTFGTWNDLWLAEGPARYAEYYAAEQVPVLGYSAASAQTLRTNLKTSALGLTAQSAWIPNSSMGTSALIWSSNYGSTVYERGGMVISMLRTLAGDVKFKQAMTNYQTQLAGRSATTDSLKNQFNAVLGVDINEFFRDYVGGSGSGTTAVGGIGNPIYTMNWNSPGTNKLVVKVASQTKTAGSNVTYFNGPIVLHFTNAASGWTKDTTIVIYDWGGGNLSYAGNGISDPYPGNALNYELSFTPTNAFYDDSSKTLSTGTVTKDVAFMGYSWGGATSTAWNTGTNWANSSVPPDGAQVSINTTGNNPTLPGTITVGSLYLAAASKLTIGNNTLTINGPVTGTGTITGSANSNITVSDVAGTLNFDQTSAATRSLNNLAVSTGGSATLGSALDVYGAITLTSASLNLNAKNLTLKSTATATARIGDLTGSTLTGATNVTVERYISDVGRRAWRLLATPVTGTQTIRQSWQENGVLAANLGTNITSPLYTGSNGFDASSNSSSILTYNQGGAGGPSWSSSLANTNSTLLTAYPGYMLFVRGDRNATAGNALHAPTVLRATGTIRQGTQSAVTVSATGTGYTLVGNPYPSPIDFEAISGTANLNQNYYLWDPTLTGNYGYGGYRLVQRTAPNTYQQTPVVLGGPVVDPTIRYIHSGQAFFLKATGSNASVVFAESAKASSTSIVNPFVNFAGDQQLVVNLMIEDAVQQTTTLADGFRVQFNDNYLNNGSDDIQKISNSNENLSVLVEGSPVIVVNRPLINAPDTLFLNMTGIRIRNYRFQVGTFDLVQTNLAAKLVDNYQGTSTPLNLSIINEIPFAVNADPASAAANRFMIVFSPGATLPIRFSSIRAYRQQEQVNVEWKVTSQTNIHHYDVERSANGVNFVKLTEVAATGLNGSDATYASIDQLPFAGDNYYRIRSFSHGGEIRISPIAKVTMIKRDPSISVYPNPVTESSLGLLFSEMIKGSYQLRMLNTMGQVVLTQVLSHNGGSASLSVPLAKTIGKGIYRLEIIKPDQKKEVRTVMVD